MLDFNKLIFRFLDDFERVLNGAKPITVILDDPSGNSYVQALDDEGDGKADPNLRIFHYNRSHEQNDDLGLNDMKVEGYEADEAAKAK